jgi:hypothetical protein
MSLRKVKAAGSPRQRFSTEERQDEIVRAAVDLAGTQGVDNVTTQDIAEVVGVTRGSNLPAFSQQGHHMDRGRPLGARTADERG